MEKGFILEIYVAYRIIETTEEAVQTTEQRLKIKISGKTP